MITLRPREDKETPKDKSGGVAQPEAKKPSEEKPVKKSKKNYQKIPKSS